MSKNAPRHRNVVFTINATYPHALRLLDMEHDTWQKVKFCVYQRECAEHEHFQGYMELTDQLTYDALHKLAGLETPMTIADISTGAIYVYFRTLNNQAFTTGLVDAVARLRYTD